MKRPLCAVALAMLGVGVVCSFLPQAVSFWPLAAIFVLILCALMLLRRTRKLALCLLIGTAAGLASVYHTNQVLEQTRVRYAGRKVVLTAEVLSAAESYLPGRVEAVLQVQMLNGNAVEFVVQCDALPECQAGELIRGSFVLSGPSEADRIELYADGIALDAELLNEEFESLGQSKSFRARTARLQKMLSRSLSSRLDVDTSGVLAAMTVGDRSRLTSALRSAYRGAGLSHVLVISGLHVSILCGDVFEGILLRRKRERSARSRRLQALWSALLALVLVGVTGFTPSVERAAIAVWVSALGVWIHGTPDAMTSLAAAGVLITLGNSYAVCDVGFELSFAAVLGTLAGAECYRRAQKSRVQRREQSAAATQKQTVAQRVADKLWEGLLESLLVSGCASAATFPVLVLRGLSVSLHAVLSSVAVLWLVKPMLLMGLAAALTGLLPVAAPLHILFSKAAELLTGLLNSWAVWLAQKPGAGIYFSTVYAALASLVIIALFALAMHWRLRLRVVLPCLMLTTVLAVGAGNLLSRDIVRVELVGNARSPSVLVSQNGTAVVLFRGGNGAQRRIEKALERHSVDHVELLVDLRTASETIAPIKADLKLQTSMLPFGCERQLKSTPAFLEVLRTADGCLVRMTIGNRRFAALSGEVRLASRIPVQWLLASAADPADVQYQECLSLSSKYDWMRHAEELPTAIALRRNGGIRLD